MDHTLLIMLCGTAVLGLMSGIIGVFAVLREQSLLGDAISHAAFPGVALMFLATWSKNPLLLLIGGALSALLSAFLVSYISQKCRLKKDTVLGILLSVFFGIGLVLLTHIQKLSVANQSILNKFLYGNAATLLSEDLYLLLVVGIFVLSVIFLFFRNFLLISFDAQYALICGYNIARWDFLLTFLQVITIVAGLQTVGVVLMSTMLIAPAAAARQWSYAMPTVLALSGLFGVLATVTGSLISASFYRLPTGPVIVVVMSSILILSILFAPHRGLIWRILQKGHA